MGESSQISFWSFLLKSDVIDYKTPFYLKKYGNYKKIEITLNRKLFFSEYGKLSFLGIEIILKAINDINLAI